MWQCAVPHNFFDHVMPQELILQNATHFEGRSLESCLSSLHPIWKCDKCASLPKPGLRMLFRCVWRHWARHASFDSLNFTSKSRRLARRAKCFWLQYPWRLSNPLAAHICNILQISVMKRQHLMLDDVEWFASCLHHVSIKNFFEKLIVVLQSSPNYRVSSMYALHLQRQSETNMRWTLEIDEPRGCWCFWGDGGPSPCPSCPSTISPPRDWRIVDRGEECHNEVPCAMKYLAPWRSWSQELLVRYQSGNMTCWVLVIVQIQCRRILYNYCTHALAAPAAVEMEDLLDPLSAAVPEKASWSLQQVRTGTPVKHVCWTHLYLVTEGIVQKRWKLFLCPRPFEQRRERSHALPLWSFLLSVRLLFSPSRWAQARSSLHSMPLRRQLHTCRLCFCTSRRNWVHRLQDNRKRGFVFGFKRGSVGMERAVNFSMCSKSGMEISL